MERGTALALLDAICAPRLDEQLVIIEEEGAGAIKALLGLHAILDELYDAQQSLLDQVMAAVRPYIEDDDDAEVYDAVQAITDDGPLDALLSRLRVTLDPWTDDDGYRFDAALGDVTEYLERP